MIEQIDRLEAEDQRRIAMLLEDDGRRERGFQAVRGAGADDAAKRSQRLAALFLVVRKIVQPVLDGGRRAQACESRAARRP